LVAFDIGALPTVRTAEEDKMLQEELAAHDNYAWPVRYRLISRVWLDPKSFVPSNAHSLPEAKAYGLVPPARVAEEVLSANQRTGPDRPPMRVSNNYRFPQPEQEQ
jgi:hypothetical protein